MVFRDKLTVLTCRLFMYFWGSYVFICFTFITVFQQQQLNLVHHWKPSPSLFPATKIAGSCSRPIGWLINILRKDEPTVPDWKADAHLPICKDERSKLWHRQNESCIERIFWRNIWDLPQCSVPQERIKKHMDEMQKKPFALPIDIITTLGMAWWLHERDAGHRKSPSCQHKKWSGRRGIEVLPGQSSWEQFPGSSWSENLAETQEREEKREGCSQPKKRLISCCYGDSWYQRRQMQKEEKTIAWFRGKSMNYFIRASCTPAGCEGTRNDCSVMWEPWEKPMDREAFVLPCPCLL